MTKKVTEKAITNKFVAAAIKDINKTDKDRKIEEVESFLATAQIECETQIGLLTTSELPKLKLDKKKAENRLNNAKAAFEKSRFSVASTFEQYVQSRDEALDTISEEQSIIEDIDNFIAEVEDKIKSFKEILIDLC